MTTKQAIQAINAQGYCVLSNVFDKTSTKQMLNAVNELAEQYADLEIKDIPRLDTGQQTIYNLQNKSTSLLQQLLGCQPATKVLQHFLNDQWHKAIDLQDPNYILRSFSARNNQVAAPLHIDSFIPYQGEHALSMQMAVVLEDQNESNGCTIVIPGSHQSGRYVSQTEKENAIPIESKAGDVVLWDSRIWHGTLDNKSGLSRWSLIATFVRWWVKQGYKITENLPQVIYQTLSDNEKAIMGYCSKPFDDEAQGIDFKKGYADLKTEVDDYL